MKKILSIIIWLVSLCAYGQLQGAFSRAQDGHIYFYLSNPTSYQIPVVWGAYNLDTNERRQSQGAMTPYSTFVYGPNYNWVWMKGETFAITYANGQTVSWTCPENDMAYNPSFRGQSSDQYIHQGSIYLERTISGKKDRFDLYNKGGVDYVKFGSSYYRISGTGTVTINNIKYNKP